MSWNLTPLADGDAVSDINTIVTDAQTAVNGITNDMLREGTFNRYHVHPLIVECYVDPATSGSSAAADHTYTQTIFGTSFTYAQGSAPSEDDGGTDSTGNNPTSSWIIVGHEDASGSYSGGTAEVAIDARLGVGNNADPADDARIWLIEGNIELRSYEYNETTDFYVVMCFQYEIQSTWRTIDSSVRVFSCDDHDFTSANTLDIDMNCTDMLTPEIIDQAGHGSDDSTTDNVTGIRMMVTAHRTGTTSGSDAFTLGNWNLTVTPLWTGDPT